MLKFVNNRFSQTHMRLIVLLLLFAFQGHSQKRMNDPLPIFSKKPIETLKRGVTGWSFSEDGQWISAKRTIPVITNSLNRSVHKTRENRIGIDNFKEFRIYPIILGSDTLVLLTKFYTDGHYKYRRSKRGWQTFKKCHYYIFNKKALNKLDALKDSIVQNIQIPLLDDGNFIYKTSWGIIGQIKKLAVLDPNYGKELIFTIQPFTQDDKIRFQFFSQHKKYKEDVSGILRDFQLDGYTVYGKLELFDHLYYETDISRFSSFLSVPASFKFKN
jgi:hypothetical protein